MAKTIIEELFAQANKDFTKHLNIEENERIIFSGKFGVGKTTFINQYFQDKKKYNPIYLYPVNYAVATNEDIFKYVKYDILYELILKYNITLDHTDFKLAFTSQFYVLNNLPKIIASFFSFIPKIGKELNDMYEKFSKLQEEAIKYHKEIKEQSDASKTSEFYNDYINIEGSIYEDNSITKLIESKLEDLKNDDSIENVLIIDDLDRIDPHHIFRLFNIFAAHFDNKEYKEKKNKFGFDKIIFVCDIENIRNIFKHQYGLNTDFSGYIDKFYSKKIFEYQFDNFLIDSFYPVFFSQTKYILNKAPAFQLHFFEAFRASFKYVLLKLIEHKTINLRKVLKYHNNQLEFLSKPIIIDKDEDITSYSVFHIPVLVLDILINLVGDRNSLKDALLEVYQTEKKYHYINQYKNEFKYELGYLLPILDSDKNKLKKGTYNYYNQECKLNVEYEIESRHRQIIYAEIKNIDFREYNATVGNPINNESFIFYLYTDLINKLEDIGYYHGDVYH